MMKARKKRKLEERRRNLKVEIAKQKQLADQTRDAEREVIRYKGMAQSFWERWQWELAQRKEEMVQQGSMKSQIVKKVPMLLEIDPKQLHNPQLQGSEDELYIGRGSFSTVKYQLYRGMPVAVKELLPRTLLCDVKKEATLMSEFCHPSLPHLFGVCIVEKPYRIVMQYHALPNGDVMTVEKATRVSVNHLHPFQSEAHITICVQVFEGLQYLHENLNILHNDIKPNNVLLSAQSSTGHAALQALLIDFGMASYIKDAKVLSLSEPEKREWFSRYSHIAPEVIDGKTSRTVHSDIFSAGGVIRRVAEGWKKEMNDYGYKLLSNAAGVCRSIMYNKRPTSNEVLKMLHGVTSAA